MNEAQHTPTVDQLNADLEDMSLSEMKDREKEMQTHLRKMGEYAKRLMSSGLPQAIGYRVLIKPITIVKTLEGHAADVAPTLAERGFEERTDKQAIKEERGGNHGIVVHLGPMAFDRLGGKEAWCDVGDCVLYTRYAGTRLEHPPGSKNYFQLVNDEDIYGKIV